MANQQHPLTPSDELLKQWETKYFEEDENFDVMLIKAYQAGADMEQEACVECLIQEGYIDAPCRLRTARRPKPPSLKEQALTALHAVATGANDTREQHQDLDTIRKALESLDD